MFATCNVPGSPYFRYFHGPGFKCQAWLNDIKKTLPEEVWQGGQLVTLKESKTAKWRNPDGTPILVRTIKPGAGRPRNKVRKQTHSFFVTNKLHKWLLRHKDTLECLLVDKQNPEAADLLESIETFYAEG